MSGAGPAPLDHEDNGPGSYRLSGIFAATAASPNNMPYPAANPCRSLLRALLLLTTGILLVPSTATNRGRGRERQHVTRPSMHFGEGGQLLASEMPLLERHHADDDLKGGAAFPQNEADESVGDDGDRSIVANSMLVRTEHSTQRHECPPLTSLGRQQAPGEKKVKERASLRDRCNAPAGRNASAGVEQQLHVHARELQPAPAYIITTVVGTGVGGFLGDGGAGLAAKLNSPYSVAADTLGNVIIADSHNNRMRMLAASSGIINTVAGTGAGGWAGDGGQGSSAQLYFPHGVVVDPVDGSVFFADTYNHCIRKLATTGVISTVAGAGGSSGFSGDGGVGTSARLSSPNDVTISGDRTLFIADQNNHRIRTLNATTGLIRTVAGNGTSGFSGDGGAGTAAQLRGPTSVAVNALGLFIADRDNHRIRLLVISTGRISTVAGTGVRGYSGDGSAGTAAQLNNPEGVAVDTVGSVFIADKDNHRVRRLTAGIISTVAGGMGGGFAGDGGAGTAAQLYFPTCVAVDDVTGNILIADNGNHLIRMLTTISQTTTPSITSTPQTATQTRMPTSSSSNTQTASQTLTQTSTISGTSSFTPTASQTVTQTGSPSSTLSNTQTASQTRSWTRTQTPTITRSRSSSITPTPSITPSGTGTPSRSGTQTQTGTQSETGTPSASNSPSSSSSPSTSPSLTTTDTPSTSRTSTATATASRSNTATATTSRSSSTTPSATRMSRSNSATRTPTSSVTVTPSGTPSVSATASVSSTQTSTSSQTGTQTATMTSTPTTTCTSTRSATQTPTKSQACGLPPRMDRFRWNMTSLYGISGTSPPVLFSELGNSNGGLYSVDINACAGYNPTFPRRLVYRIELGDISLFLGGTLYVTTCGTAPVGSDTILWGGTGCPTTASSFLCQRGSDLSRDPPMGLNCYGPDGASIGNENAAGLKWTNLAVRTVYIQVGLGPYTTNSETAASGLTWCYTPPGTSTCSGDPRWSNSKSPSPSGTVTRSRSATRTLTRTKVCD